VQTAGRFSTEEKTKKEEEKRKVYLRMDAGKRHVRKGAKAVAGRGRSLRGLGAFRKAGCRGFRTSKMLCEDTRRENPGGKEKQSRDARVYWLTMNKGEYDASRVNVHEVEKVQKKAEGGV